MAYEFKDVQLEVKSVEEDGIFLGYGSLFTTEPDASNDIIKKGAH